MSHFGPAPIIEEPYSFNNANVTLERNSIEELTEHILGLINTTLENGNLPSSNYNVPEGGNEFLRGRGMVTLAMAHAFKARVALYAASELYNPDGDMEKWEFAEEVCETAIAYVENEGHTFHAPYEQIFNVDYTDEIIWDRSNNAPNIHWKERFFWDRDLETNSNNGWGTFTPGHTFVESYETADGKYIDDPTSGYRLDSFWVNRDPRFYQSILYDGAWWRGKEYGPYYSDIDSIDPGPDTRYGANGHNATLTGYNWRKFLDSTNAPTQFDAEVMSSQQNMIFFRYTELILNYAEALLMQGKYDEARAQINKERTRPRPDGSPLMPAIPDSETGEDLIKRYRNERKVELALEGHRWHDLRRWKIAKEVLDGSNIGNLVITYKYNEDSTDVVKDYEEEKYRLPNGFKDQHYWVPIPQDEMDKAGTEGFKQNPDY